MRRLVLALWALSLLIVAAPASAGSAADPDFVDACGAGVGVPYEAVSPNNDICSGWFTSTVEDGAAQQLTITLDMLQAPTGGDPRYLLSWQTANCAFMLRHTNGPGLSETSASIVDDQTGDFLFVGCGEQRERPCETGEVANYCEAYESEREFALTNAFATEGDKVSWTLDFTGELAAVADEFAEGATLKRTYAGAGASRVYYGTNYCYGTTCGSVGGDYAVGRSYVMGG